MKNKISVAILGLGRMGGAHVFAAKASPYIDDIIGYEPDKERAELRGRELEIKATHNLDDILSNPEIKLIYIAAINAVHCDLTVKALEAGKAVLCEKPMGETLDEAREMMNAQKATGGFLQIGFELRYSKMYQTVKDWIDQGLIGTPVNCQCRYYCSEFHLKNSWRSNSSGTLIGEKLSHYLDLPRWWFGSPVKNVYSLSAPNFVPYFNHSDNHQINYKFENGAISVLNFIMGIAETDYDDPLLEILEKQADDGHYLQYHIVGTGGAIETDVFRRRMRRWKFTEDEKQLRSEIVETITYTKEDDTEWMHNTVGQNIAIAELVAKGLPPGSSAHDAYETMKLCYATEISEKESRIVPLSEIK